MLHANTHWQEVLSEGDNGGWIPEGGNGVWKAFLRVQMGAGSHSCGWQWGLESLLSMAMGARSHCWRWEWGLEDTAEVGNGGRNWWQQGILTVNVNGEWQGALSESVKRERGRILIGHNGNRNWQQLGATHWQYVPGIPALIWLGLLTFLSPYITVGLNGIRSWEWQGAFTDVMV